MDKLLIISLLLNIFLAFAGLFHCNEIEKLEKQTNRILKDLKEAGLLSRYEIIRWIDDSVKHYGLNYNQDELDMFKMFKDWIGRMPEYPKRYDYKENENDDT